MASNHQSDFDEVVYENYREDTVDPGQTLFIIALVFCISSFLCLPLCVKVGKRYLKNSCITDRKRNHDENGIFDKAIRRRKRGTFAGENTELRRMLIAREARESLFLSRDPRVDVHLSNNDVELILGPDQARVDVHSSKNEVELVLDSDLYSIDGTQTLGMVPDQEEGNYQPPSIKPLGDNYEQTQKNFVSPQHSREKRRVRMWNIMEKMRVRMWNIIKIDHESKRILRLVMPFTVSAIIESISDLITAALVSHALGTDSLVALIMVDSVIGISSSLTFGWIEATTSLGSMAIGAQNFELVGHYVQMSCILYILSEIPMACFWYNYMGGIIRWLGFSESVADIAHSFVWVQVAINMISGLNSGLLDFLAVIDKATSSSIMYCISCVVDVGIAALLATKTEAPLAMFGLAWLATEAMFFALNIAISKWMGWLKHFRYASFFDYGLNKAVLKQLFKTALPLSFGGLIAYAEWEILIVFAALIGPAEAAAWTLLGLIWDLFESTTSAIGSASEIRCSYHLGQGRPEMAKISAYKSMLLAGLASLFVTSTFVRFNHYLASWLTSDATLQAMLAELFPLIALGNVTMNMGMVSWAILGAQGRYRLATSIATACSLLITIPIGALMTCALKIDLQGLTFAVVIGYGVMAMVLAMMFLMSDWGYISKKIQDKMAAKDDSDTDDESDESADGITGKNGPESPLGGDDFSVKVLGYIQSALPTSWELNVSQRLNIHALA